LQRHAVLMMLPAGACALGKHAEQLALPASGLKVSAAHAAHAPAAPVEPALQRQAVLSEDGVESAGQSAQASLPVAALAVLGGHAAHVPDAPENPGLHTQAAAEVLAGGEMEFGGHTAHPSPSCIVWAISLFSACEASQKSSSDKW